MKCRYMDELTGGRGITFATGTPVSNSMTELYTIMRYQMCIRDRPVSEPVPDRKAEQPSGRDREGSTGEDGQPDGETAEEPSGTGQGSRPDGVDSTYERTECNSEMCIRDRIHSCQK